MSINLTDMIKDEMKTLIEKLDNHENRITILERTAL